MSYSLPCEGIRAEMRKYLEYLENAKYELDNAISDFENEIRSLDDDLEAIIEDIDNEVNKVLNEVNELRSLVGSFTGSCLNGVFNEASGLIMSTSDLIDMVLEPIADVINQFNVLDAMKVVGGSLGVGGLRIPDIVGYVDEFLGCLSDADCLLIDEADQYIEFVNDFLDRYGLSDTGEFDIGNIIDKAISEMGSLGQRIKDSLIEINTKFEGLKNDCLEILRSVKKTTSHSSANVPEELY